MDTSAPSGFDYFNIAQTCVRKNGQLRLNAPKRDTFGNLPKNRRAPAGIQDRRKSGPPDWVNRFWRGFADSNCRRFAASGQSSFAGLDLRFAHEVGSSNTKRCEKPVHPNGTNRLLELLGRFELPTSSLPMTRSTD